ncbi:MAG: FKBP-type peptidyl-prolyl cis-trans isomerase [Salibacteraceae bacterium]
MRFIVIIWLMVTLVNACNDKASSKKIELTQQEVNRGMEDVNRQMTLEEDAVIEGYAERRGWNMIKTGTGVRYEIYKSGPDGPLAKEGQVAELNYKVSLIDGTVVYSSDKVGSRSFLIGQDNVESGLHEAVTYMKVGDHARVILPSHRAHGLSGDNQKIPPRSTVIYDLHLLALK